MSTQKEEKEILKMKYIPLIIVLLLILAILVLVFYGVSRVKRFSRQLFGTDDIIQGVKKSTGGCRVNTAFGFCDDKDCPASDRFRFPGFSIR